MFYWQSAVFQYAHAVCVRIPCALGPRCAVGLYSGTAVVFIVSVVLRESVSSKLFLAIQLLL